VLRVALTGNVASGKSTVAGLWARAGVPVVSADELSRRAVLPETTGLRAVREAFGDGVLDADGGLDRARMRALAFGDPAARARLEAILHPRIRALREAWLEERRRAGDALVVSEIPLLFETGTEREHDVVVLVDARPEVRLERLVRTRGLGEAEARDVMAAQGDAAAKRAAADVVIDNDGSLAELEAAAAEVLADLRARAGATVPMRLDLHLHTWGSRDCSSDPEAVLREALRLGYGRIAITDHDRLGVALRMSEAHPGRIIPGEEVKTAEGVDVIGLHLRDEIAKGTPAIETIERIRAQGGLAYLPHPYAPGKGGGGRLADELARRCDVVEIFNARLHDPALNRRAEELAVKHGKLRGAGSDAHTLGELGNAWVEVPDHPNRADALLRALAEAARVGGVAAPRIVHLASTWAKVRKRLPGAPGATEVARP
jgi:dephospho-CoA kinase